MRLKLAVATFLFLILLPLGLKQIRSTQYVAKVETSPKRIQKQDKSVFDLISDLDSSLTEIRRMEDVRWARNIFKPIIKRREAIKKETEKQKEASRPHLTSILVNKRNCYAIVDNQIVRVGDMVKNMKVTKIEMGKVTLRFGNQTITLTVD